MWDDHDSHVGELIALAADGAVARSVFAEAGYRWAHLTVEAQEKATTTTDGLKAIKKREGRRHRDVKTP
jgi:hypothetical protein